MTDQWHEELQEKKTKAHKQIMDSLKGFTVFHAQQVIVAIARDILLQSEINDKVISIEQPASK